MLKIMVVLILFFMLPSENTIQYSMFLINVQSLMNVHCGISDNDSHRAGLKMFLKKSYRCLKFNGNAKQPLEIRVEQKSNVVVG